MPKAKSPRIGTGFVTSDNQMFSSYSAASDHELALLFSRWKYDGNRINSLYTSGENVAEFIKEKKEDILRILNGD